MKNKTLLIICLIIIATIILIGGYFVFIKDNNEKAAFLKLEKIVLKDDEKKVKVNNKELTLKLDNGLFINDNKINAELIMNVYNTGEYLIISYKGNENEKYIFINNEGKEITVTMEGINEDAEFANLRLEGNELLVDTCDITAIITYKEGKIIIKK